MQHCFFSIVKTTALMQLNTVGRRLRVSRIFHTIKQKVVLPLTANSLKTNFVWIDIENTLIKQPRSRKRRQSESSLLCPALCGVTGSGQSRGTYKRLVCLQMSQ